MRALSPRYRGLLQFSARRRKRASLLSVLAFPPFLELKSIFSGLSPVPGKVGILILRLPTASLEGGKKNVNAQVRT